MSEDGKAENSGPRVLCADDPKLDDTWNKTKRALKKFPFLQRLMTSQNEVEPRISPAEACSVTKCWNMYKGCDKDAGGVNSSRWLEHALQCEPLAQAVGHVATRTPPALEK